MQQKNKALLKVTAKPSAAAASKPPVRKLATTAFVTRVTPPAPANKGRLSASIKNSSKKITSDESEEDEDEEKEEDEDVSGRRGYRTASLSSSAISRLVSSKNERKKPSPAPSPAAGRGGALPSKMVPVAAAASPPPAASSVLLAEVELRRSFVAVKSDKVGSQL